MLICFFDIDGVFNFTDWYISDRNPGTLFGQEGELDPFVVERFNKIWKETGCSFVMTSDWRLDFPAACKRLYNVGAEFPIIGCTPCHLFDKTISDKTRGNEIEHWIKDNLQNEENFNFVIVDDRTDFKKSQKKHFVHVNPKIGFTDDDMNKTIEILKNNEKICKNIL